MVGWLARAVGRRPCQRAQAVHWARMTEVERLFDAIAPVDVVEEVLASLWGTEALRSPPARTVVMQ